MKRPDFNSKRIFDKTLPMTASSARQSPSRFLLTLISGGFLIACAGCQTFSLTKEDFQKQQNGQSVNRETDDAVGIVGTLGYYGVAMGEAMAKIFGK